MRDGRYEMKVADSDRADFLVEGGYVTQVTGAPDRGLPNGSVRRVDNFYRLLLTGSRDYQDREAVRRDLIAVLNKWGCRPDQVVVIQGMARGLDTVARSAALELGMRVEDHPVTKADWERYGKSAGHRRNAPMVAAAARLPAARRGVIAYPIGESRGTRGCMAMAEKTPELKGKVWNRTDPPASVGGPRPARTPDASTRQRR